ncbi:MAG: minor capsid protein [Desulfovibrio sp.]|nr:minor capsid protein [Desulfovibrio sp.]
MNTIQDKIFKFAHRVEARGNSLADEMRRTLEGVLGEIIAQTAKLQATYLMTEKWDKEVYKRKYAYLKAQRVNVEALLEGTFEAMRPPVEDAAFDVMEGAAALAESISTGKIAIGGGASYVTPTMLEDWITTQTIEGLLINEWLQKMSTATADKIVIAGRESLVLGHSAQQAANHLRENGISGTVPKLYALARTFLLSASNYASEAAFESLGGVHGWEYLATLDGRTCPICGAYDGKYFPHGKPRPSLPQHVNCRCVYIPHHSPPKFHPDKPEHRLYDGDTEGYLKWDIEQTTRNGIPPRPAVKHDESTVHHRDGSTSTKYKVGSVEHTTENYSQWLKRQLREDPAFVRSILGKTRFELFKAGKISLEKMVVDGRLKKISEL